MVAKLKVIEGSKDIVEMLEYLTEQAKNGRYTCFAFAALADGGVSSGWTSPQRGEHTRLMGAVSYLTHRLAMNLDASDE